MYKILLVDDYPVIREVMQEFFELSACEFEIIAEASNGKEALDLAAEYHPDLILMDITMPIMDGLEATRHLVADKNPAVIITYTSYQYNDLRQKAIQAGATAHMVKPFDFNDLIRTMQKAINQKTA